jgi:putative copper resistance protein D
MGQQELIAGDWYLALREGPMGAWLPAAADDQHLAGGILWGSGDLIGLAFFGVLFAQWVRSSMQEARREDRRLDLLEARAAAERARGESRSSAPHAAPGTATGGSETDR